MSVTRRLQRWGVLLACLTAPYFTYASQVSVEMTGGRFELASVESVPGGQAPAYWEIPLGLPAAQRVIPGGVTNDAEQMVVVSFGGKSISVPITVKGMIYRLSSNVLSTNEPTGTASTSLSGSDVLVTGKGAGGQSFELKALESPITHYRPYFSNIKDADWINAFKAASAPKGVYRGSLPVTATYDYLRDGVRVRYTLTFSVSVVVDYSPQYLNMVTATGENAMTVNYHYPLLVSGETQYTITATGYFTNGIWVGLMPPENGDYFSLKNKAGDKELKYNVTCESGCIGDNRLIVNGIPQIDTTTKRAVIGAVDTERAVATLKVNFDPVSEKDFRGETYSGAFTLMFEARI